MITMSVGALKVPSEKGNPVMVDSAPELEFMENPESVLSTLFATKRKASEGSVETPNGCWPVFAVDVGDKEPLLIAKVETVPACTFVAKTNLSIVSTVRRNGLLWQEELQPLVFGGGRDEALREPFAPICNAATDSAMWLPTKRDLPSVAIPTGVVRPAGLEVWN